VKKIRNIAFVASLLAWSIIFLHAVIPHHHHYFDHVCEKHDSEFAGYVIENDTDAHEDCACDDCNFSADFLSQHQIDGFYFFQSAESFSPKIQLKDFSFIDRPVFIPDDLLYLSYGLRAPPAFS